MWQFIAGFWAGLLFCFLLDTWCLSQRMKRRTRKQPDAPQ